MSTTILRSDLARNGLACCLLLGAFTALEGCGGGGGGGSVSASGSGVPPPVNQAPVASNSCAYASGVNQQFNGTGALSLSATDPEGQSLTYFLLSSGSNGLAMITNPLTGEFVYTPNTNSRGTDEFTFLACEAAPSTVCSNVATYKIVHTPRIMALGDSITDGATTNSPPDNGPPVSIRVGYRKPLKDALTAAGYLTDFVGTQNSGSAIFSDPEHEGHGGFTADQLNLGKTPVPNLATRLNVSQPDVVLLHAGTNDLSAAGVQSDQWTDIEAILTTIDSWESANWPVTVVVARIIKRNLSGDPNPTETTDFNNNVINSVVIPRLSGSDQIIWVDQESALVQSTGDYADSLHPSSSGYPKMANVWLFPLAGAGFGAATGSHSPAGAGILPKCP